MQKISREAIMAASEMLDNCLLDHPKDLAIVNRRFAEKIKKDQRFEPLHMYSGDVQPYFGEIGRYDCGGFKVRIVVNNVNAEVDLQWAKG